MPHGTVHIIVNPISGNNRDPEFVPELVRHLALRGFAAEVFPTERAGHATELARQTPDDARCIISVGGDGTHREVLAGLIGKPVPMCAVPRGTENVMARTFGFVGNLRDTLLRVQMGRPVPLDIGLANGHPFVLFAGAGFDAAVTQEVHKNRHGPIQRHTYYGVIARMWWRYGYRPLSVTVDGRTLADDVSFVLVANTPRYADGLRIAPRALGDDGLLDVICYRHPSRWGLLHAYALTLLRKHLESSDVATARGRRVEVTCAAENIPVQIDGDAILTTPAVCTILPKAVRLLVSNGKAS